MVKRVLLTKVFPILAMLLSLTLGTKAQTYTETTPFVEIVNYGDTLKYWLHNLPAGAWGTATVKVYYEGDFGDDIEFIDFYGPGNTYIGTAGPYAGGSDCAGIDSVTFSFPASLLTPLLPADSLLIFGLATGDVDPGVCTISQAQVSARYNYCQFGVPQQFASFTVSDSSVCPSGGLVTLIGTPANGTFTGTNVSGTSFNPAGLSNGSYNITYTATDGIGCVTSTTKTVRVERSPLVQNVTVCPGSTALLDVNGEWSRFVWYSNNSLTNALDTTTSNTSFTTAPANTTTSYYVVGLNESVTFKVDTLLETDSLVVDHDAITDDDRGGIAVTQNYVYIIGDNSGVRYNLDYTNPVAVPMRDGLFSDLSTGILYTLYDGTNPPAGVNSQYVINSFMELDVNLGLTSSITPLSQNITFSSDNNGIFVGPGFVVLYSDFDSHLYAVNTSSGYVQDLGTWSSELYGSENWSDWGVAEFDGTNYYILYRDYNDQNIHRLNVTTGTITTAGVFSDISDLSSFTVSPWNNRWYFHYESDGQFGGTDETGGYADAALTITPISATNSCPSEVSLIVNTVSLGEDTVICEGTSVVLFAGTGYTQYAWNGTTTNFNAVSASEQGIYTVAVVDADGCTLSDTVNVIVNDAPNPTIDLGNSFIYCSNAAAVALTASPANGTFSGAGITGSSFSPATAGVGVHEITYTVTGNNGCVGSTMDYLVVENCTGIEDIALSELNVYPNPSTGLVNVQFGAQVNDATVTVYDLQGREVYNTSNLINNNIALNLSQVGSGVYQLRIAANGNTTTKRLVIQQ